MKHYKYLIIGGGLAADAAVVGIRAIDPDGTIGLVSSEPHPPYRRPMLSKALWQGTPLEAVWLETRDAGVEIHLNRTIVHLDLSIREAYDRHSEVYHFEKLLIATGCFPVHLPGTQDSDELIYFRTLDDYHHLRALCEQKQRFAVIGGGFIGSEIAAALAQEKKQVTMLFPEVGILRRLLPEEFALHLNDYYRQRGIEVCAEEWVESIEQTAAGEWEVRTKEGQAWRVDAVIAGLGVLPHDELAKQAGIQTGDGILVDEYLCTSYPGVYAAGDVANFHHAALHIRMRVEHEDNAIAMGFCAGQNMAGEGVSYEHSPFFYSQLFDLHYHAVGVIDADTDIVIDQRELLTTGSLYYLQEGIVQGILLWGKTGGLDAAKERLGKPYKESA